MDFEKCKKEHLKLVEPDFDQIKSIIKVAEIRLKAIMQIQKDDETTSIIVEGYYEIIKELLVALLLKNSLKSDNHECLISYFKHNHKNYEYECMIIHQLKNIRNRINYEGILVKMPYLTANEPEFNHIINVLKDLIKVY